MTSTATASGVHKDRGSSFFQRLNGVPWRLYRASEGICQACPAFGVCTKSKEFGRSVTIGPYDAALRRHRVWMSTNEARDAYKRRKPLVEPVFGIIKRATGGSEILVAWLRERARPSGLCWAQPSTCAPSGECGASASLPIYFAAQSLTSLPKRVAKTTGAHWSQVPSPAFALQASPCGESSLTQAGRNIAFGTGSYSAFFCVFGQSDPQAGPCRQCTGLDRVRSESERKKQDHRNWEFLRPCFVLIKIEV